MLRVCLSNQHTYCIWNSTHAWKGTPLRVGGVPILLWTSQITICKDFLIGHLLLYRSERQKRAGLPFRLYILYIYQLLKNSYFSFLYKKFLVIRLCLRRNCTQCPPHLKFANFFLMFLKISFSQSQQRERRNQKFFPCLKIPRHLASAYSLSAGTGTVSTP